MSAQTRPTITPTVRHAIRINAVTAVFEHCVASHATVSSKASVCPAPCRAPGHLRDYDAVLRAGHPRRLGLDIGPHRPQVECPRAPPPLAGVVAAAPGLTDPAPTTRRTHRANVTNQPPAAGHCAGRAVLVVEPKGDLVGASLP